jgi:hypothetical protein
MILLNQYRAQFPKNNIFLFGFLFCLWVSLCSTLMASNTINAADDRGGQEKTPQITNGYRIEVFDNLRKISPTLPLHNVVQTQLYNNNAGNEFLQEQAQKSFALFWALVIGQKKNFNTLSQLTAFDAAVNKKFVTDLEGLQTATWDAIKPKNVTLPSPDTYLSLQDEGKISLEEVDKALFTDTGRLIREKIEQSEINALQSVTIKDLSQSMVLYQNDAKQSIDQTMKKLLIDETYNTIHILIWLRAILEYVQEDTNKLVKKNASIAEEFKTIIGLKDQFGKAKNTKDEMAQHQSNLSIHREYLEKLLMDRRQTQQESREKMIEFANIIKAPSEKTDDIERMIYEAWPVDGDVAYSRGYFSYWPKITNHGIINSCYTNIFGAPHPRSIKVQEQVNPLIQEAHISHVFLAMKNDLIQNNPKIEEFLCSIFDSFKTLGLKHPVDTSSESNVPDALEKKDFTAEVNDVPNSIGIETLPTIAEEGCVKNSHEFSQTPLSKEVNVGEIASEAASYITDLLNKL